ncbi:MAG TPA: GreA/GreB family elongation factor [Thermomicrobiales bacterium]|nr:GreA/GreB family elongation factor [Thermomicrobiales bacterium]
MADDEAAAPNDLDESLIAEMRRMLEQKRAEFDHALSDADDIMRGWSDIAEKASYGDSVESIRRAIDFYEARISALSETIDSRAPSDESPTTVQLGSTVVVDIDGDQEQYVLVRSEAATPSHGLLSIESPLAQALLGKQAGEIAEVESPAGWMSVRLLRVE